MDDETREVLVEMLRSLQRIAAAIEDLARHVNPDFRPFGDDKETPRVQ